MRSMIIGLILVSSSAFAGEYVSQKFSVSVGGMGGWNTTYYNCDSLEDRVESNLEKLGAVNVRVRCSGGLDTWGHMPPMPAYVTASFDAPVAGTTTTRALTIKSRMGDSCEADVATFDAALPLFPAITVLSRKASCSFGNNGRWSYDLSIAE